MTGLETLLARALLILRSAAPAGALAREWSLGGGTALMLRYRHRASEDIDIFVPDPQVLGYLSPRLNPVAESLTSNYLEQANFVKLYFPEGQIDFLVSAPLTPQPVTRETFLGQAIPLETPAEIVAKKIWYRAWAFTARDVFDVAAVLEREPAALSAIRDLIALRRSALLQRLREGEEALRENFAALEVLDFRPRFDDCLEAVTALLDSVSPHRTEQKRARYDVTPPRTAFRQVEKWGLSPFFRPLFSLPAAAVRRSRS